jgi:biopolymer transport protein TolR
MARFSRKQRRHISATTPEISLTPLIDTALTLLIIFMVTTPIIQNAIKVTLPKGNAKESSEAQQDLVVYLDKNGKIFLNDASFTSESLIPALQKQIGNGQQKTVFVKADTAISYGHVIELVDRIKVVGGVHYVALATQQRT